MTRSVDVVTVGRHLDTQDLFLEQVPQLLQVGLELLRAVLFPALDHSQVGVKLRTLEIRAELLHEQWHCQGSEQA